MARLHMMLLAALVCSQAVGQLRNKNWIFGFGAGLTFENGGPVPYATGLPYVQISSSISDQYGELRLVVNDEHLRDSSLAIMPNGAGPLFPNGGGLYQGITIFPRTGNNDLYDVIIRPGAGPPRYTVHPTHMLVDLSLNNGYGDVVQGSQTTLQDSVCIATLGTTHSNGQDYWYVTHERGTDAFLAYRLDANGFDTVPVVSNTGPVYVYATYSSGDLYHQAAQWAFNVPGDKLLVTGYYGVYSTIGDTLPGILEVYGFNQTTGEFIRELNLPDLERPIFCEWSPDGSKIYVAERTNPGMDLYQYDLSSGDSATIAASRVTIHQFPQYNGARELQLGPDGRIYISRTGGLIGYSFLSCITEPDLPGTACGFVDQYIDFPLPNFPGVVPMLLKQYHDSGFPLANPEAREAYDQQLAIWPNPAEGVAYVKLPLDGDVDRLVITDATGRLALRVAPSNFTMQPLDLSGLSPGVYSLGAFAAERRVGVASFVVQ